MSSCLFQVLCQLACIRLWGRGGGWWKGLRLKEGWGSGIHVSIPGAYKLLSVLACCRRSKLSDRQLQQHVEEQMSKKKRRICPCLKFREELTSSVTGSAWQAWACQARSCQHHCQVCHVCIFVHPLSRTLVFMIVAMNYIDLGCADPQFVFY